MSAKKNASGISGVKKEVACPLCGSKFVPEPESYCKACIKFSACDLVICPNCGFEFPRSLA